MKKFAIVFLTAILTVMMPSVTLSQDQTETRTVDVIGTGRIYGEAVSTARDHAISDCLITAVSMVSADLLNQPVLIQSFHEINSLLLSRSEQYIQGYRVLTEVTTGRVYRVMVEATVSVDRIRILLGEAGLLMESDAPLKVLLMIAEKDLDNPDYQYWWGDPFAEAVSEVRLAESLGGRGFILVDHGQLWPADRDPSFFKTEIPLGAELSDDQAASFGAWFQADLVVTGTATSEIAPNVLGDELRSFRGAMSLRVIRTETGSILSDITQDIITVNANIRDGGQEALAEAGARTGDVLAEKIQVAWEQETAPLGPVTATVVVEGGYQLADLVALRSTLSEMPEVSNLQTRGMTPEETTLVLDYEGTTQDMAEALLLHAFGGFGIHITETGPDMIRMLLVSD